MTGSAAAAWTIAIVVSIVLFGWLGAVLWANSHPRWKHQSSLPKYEVTGGAFQAVDGGRQLMPRYGGRPIPVTDEEMARARNIPAQRTAAGQETPAGAESAEGSQDAGERHLVAGSQLR